MAFFGKSFSPSSSGHDLQRSSPIRGKQGRRIEAIENKEVGRNAAVTAGAAAAIADAEGDRGANEKRLGSIRV